MRKGQFLSLDFIISIVIFVGLLISFFSINQFASERAIEAELHADIHMAARRAFAVILTTPGIPGAWETTPSPPTDYGIASAPNIIHPEKARFLVVHNNTRYDQIRRSLGLIPHHFSLRVYKYNETISGFNPTPSIVIGKDPPITTRERVVLERLITDQQGFGRARMEVWDQ